MDFICGPGNLFVALAKRYVYGEVAIDSIAGPSELVLVADESMDPDLAAADLVAQAEHAPGSSLLLTTSKRLIGDVQHALGRLLPTLSRSEAAREEDGLSAPPLGSEHEREDQKDDTIPTDASVNRAEEA